MGRADGVDERVAFTPSLLEEAERSLDLARVEEVALQTDRVDGAGRVEGVLGLAQLGVVASEDGDAGALRGQELGRRTTHAACPSRDDRRPT